MKKLESIQIQNFKAFSEQINIPVEGKHILAWGVNGSGKSSLYWALYTFLQCSAKPADEAKKYFDRGEESLHNLFTPERIESSISLNFKEPGSELSAYKLSLNQNDTQNEFIRSLNTGSEFITHRLLLNFYNYRNSQKIDLFPIFDRDIFPYFTTSSGNNFRTLLNNVRDNLNTETRKNINKYFIFLSLLSP